MNDYRDEAARPFYSSKVWIACRKAYASSKGYLCERCYSRGIVKRGEIVHHIEPLNAGNIKDPAISLNWDNLYLVCRKCHGEIHAERRFSIDDNGHVSAIDIRKDVTEQS